MQRGPVRTAAAAFAAAACTVASAIGVPGLAQGARSGTVVNDTLWSQALAARKSLVLYLPPSYASSPGRRYPVAYYLHGATGDETNWTRQGSIHRILDSLIAGGMPEMIVAMPDGDAYSYYTTFNVLLDAAGCRRMMLTAAGNADSDCVAWPHYDDYIAYDVVRHVDRKYRTIAAREGRAIAGLSMGGYGAVMLALQYPGTFAAAASHSGVLSPVERAPPPIGKPLPRSPADSAAFARINAQQAARFRVVFGADSASWHARDPATRAHQLADDGDALPALFADVGRDDIYAPQTRVFVEAMASRGIRVAYREWPGGHTWDYWRAHVGESLAWIAGRIAIP